ncbi:MAG: hypothetical protein QXS50_04275 [Candidatus Caldarchaeum sp.]
MAYRVSKTSALQTAIKAAVDIAIAELNAGLVNNHDEVMALVDSLKQQFTDELYPMVEEDNALQAASDAAASRSTGGSSRPPVSLQDALNTVLNFGAFKGLTLGDVANMDATETATYTQGKYSKSGVEWLKWAAGNKDPKAAFIRVRAQKVLDSLQP